MADYQAGREAPGATPVNVMGYNGEYTSPGLGTPYTSPGTVPNKEDFWRGDPDLWSAEVSLSPDQQKLMDADTKSRLQLAGLQGQAGDRVSGALSSPFSLKNAPKSASAYDPKADTDAAFKLMMERLAPQQSQREEATRNRLANQGATAGSEAWETELDQLARDQNDQRIAAALSSFDLGMKQQGQTFGQQTTLRDKGIQEMLLERQQPINELNSLRSGSQMTMPTFSSVPQQANVAAPNYMGAASNQFDANSDIFNFKETQKAQNQQTWMEMAKMFGQMFAFSDITIKQAINLLGRFHNGLGWYSYFNRLTGRWEEGLLAQEVQAVKPEAVRRHPNGLLQVNYALALE